MPARKQRAAAVSGRCMNIAVFKLTTNVRPVLASVDWTAYNCIADLSQIFSQPPNSAAAIPTKGTTANPEYAADGASIDRERSEVMECAVIEEDGRRKPRENFEYT